MKKKIVKTKFHLILFFIFSRMFPHPLFHSDIGLNYIFFVQGEGQGNPRRMYIPGLQDSKKNMKGQNKLKRYKK